MTRILQGAGAGFLATVPMTIVMEALHARLAGEPPRPLPPREIAEVAVVKAGVSRQVSERDMQDLTLASHFGYGALCGAVFGAVAPKDPASAVGAGMLFGLGVWAGSYLGWLPAAGMRHSPRHDPAARSGLMIASHMVWGLTAGLLLGRPRITGRRRAGEPLARASTPGRARA